MYVHIGKFLPEPCMSDSESLQFDSDVGFDSDEFDSISEVETGLGDLSLETKFSFLTLEDICQRLEGITSRVMDMTTKKKGVCQIMLHAFGWDVAKLISAYLEKPDEIVTGLKLDNMSDLDLMRPCHAGSAPLSNTAQHTPESDTDGKSKHKKILCPICCEDVELEQCTAMECRHFVCKRCFDLHTKYRMLEERHFFDTRCPGNIDCTLIIPQEMLSERFLTEFHQLVAQQYFHSRASQYRHCPHKNCVYIAWNQNGPCASQYSVQNSSKSLEKECSAVECPCSRTFCFNCGLPFDHLALSCELANRWLQLVAKDELDSIYLKQNSKKCPNCASDTERDGGCNHIKCAVCHYEYCWMCMESWDGHKLSPYNCIRYRPESNGSVSGKNSKNSKRRAKKQDNRLVFYGGRFINHSVLAQSVASRSHRRGHNLMSWAFALLYFLENSNNKVLLEDLVTALAVDLENASVHVEQRINALHRFIMETEWSIAR